MKTRKKYHLTLFHIFQILGDTWFVAGIIGFAENVARTSAEPIYLYRFNLDASRNVFKRRVGIQEPGTSHGDEKGYIFDCKLPIFYDKPDSPLQLGTIEEAAINRFMRLYGNFLKCGNPTPDPSEFGLTWKPVTPDSLNYLNFEEELSMKLNPEEERMKIWREIYKLHENTKKFMT